MKVLSMVFISLFAQAAFANVIVKGNDARSVMEALIANGFPLESAEGEWSGQTLKVKTKDISCRYSAIFPDEMMANVKCSEGEYTNPPYLNESLGLAKSLEKLVEFEPAAGSRYMTVNAINCSMIYDSKTYECTIVL
ncbi:MAG: hypothetical protein H7177_06385 [Rhizobacter sp.]|nr:hypothetical protein [Bacteriovorax sp.]